MVRNEEPGDSNVAGRPLWGRPHASGRMIKDGAEMNQRAGLAAAPPRLDKYIFDSLLR